ncbi:ribonuclease H-like domain-containing protein [Halapricum hydrolyticum]|uniref:Ribonuclease H-like domain-containing protein n=1 Tax=Halapricum hydrolyticum TaxID=2979991 RepID=A0AAE3ICE5_9EURY|nr:ribonuclease H-like domain-containing protein [Halapricum hydrolyticum]MCU4718816.1 ribonuclease H-like domain-containing protein [Halapricum hydrolyticum]MCU4727776.1 ribonuclease H-like domain-containing protein [Halapricum hydrolyticum]
MRVENSFIPVEGVGETTERRLWEQGITHWNDFYPDAVGETTGRRIESFIDRASDRLRAGDAEFFAREFPSAEQWRLFETFRENACFFDIETTGLDADRNKVTTVSARLDGDTTTLVQGRDLHDDALQDLFADADLLVTFNGKRFDVPFLETHFDVSLSEKPHLDLMYPCRRLDLTGGLKTIEQEIGIGRDRPDITGKEAVDLWYQYERGDESALETLVSYNREDVENLEPLTERVSERLERAVMPETATLR